MVDGQLARGGEVAVQPVVFHRVMDTVAADAWQVVQQPDRLTVLLAGAPNGFDDRLAGQLAGELARLTATMPPIDVRHVGAIPRAALGKAPLIRTAPP